MLRIDSEGFLLWSLVILISLQSSLVAGGLPGASQEARVAFPVVPTGEWTKVDEIRLRFNTYHPQGLVKVGDRFFLTAVETVEGPQPISGGGRSPGRGVGHLFVFDPAGTLVESVTLGEGHHYHPGGIDFDGRFIWVPVAEYRPQSSTIIYKVSVPDLEVKEAFRVNDHIGALVAFRNEGPLLGMSWGSREFYSWDREGRQLSRRQNPGHYIEYQDCKQVDGETVLCSGLNSFVNAEGVQFDLGGLELIEPFALRTSAQVPVGIYAADGTVLTNNPFDFEVGASELKLYFVPEDEDSNLFIYRIPFGPE
ncbi:MAG: hypothetical protein JSU96_11600 [Acidobacteriota bacterium]|nr:MAG: hypothetical protein JSU96_11600 [Acidobacteriota bacterium]